MGDVAWGSEGVAMQKLAMLGRRRDALQARRKSGEVIDEGKLRGIDARMDAICGGGDVGFTPNPVKRADEPKFTRPPAVLVERMVDNPLDTEGQATAGAGYRKIRATVNMVERIGGLARVKGLTEVQIEAASRYRRMWEGAQLGAGGAIDYGRVKVDTSGPGADGGLAGSMDALEGYRRAVDALGMTGSALLDQVVCQDKSLRDVARKRGGLGGRARSGIDAELRATLDRLADHLRLVGRGVRAPMRFEGARPTTLVDGAREVA